MSEKYDAIIIGAGIIGCCIAFELSKRGYKTLNVDTLHGAGYGSTSGSCAIIRLHYSTPDGVAMAREGFYYWQEWEKYLEVADETGVVNYVHTGCLVIKTERNKYLKHVMASLDDLDVEYEELTPSEVVERYPFLDPRQFGPPKTADDEGFGEPTGDSILGAVYIRDTGYISDPQQSVHNVQRAAEAKGAAFRFNSEVTDIRKEGERVAGITLKDGTRIDAPIVVNVAGPLLVDSMLRVGYAIFMIGTLGFLGVGLPPPDPDWGSMVNEARKFIFSNQLAVIWPALSIATLVIGLNLFADGLREELSRYQK